MQTLQQLLEKDARTRVGIDTALSTDDYRYVLREAARIFRESNVREAFPTTILNDPGILKTRKTRIVDLGEAHHGMSGTGGTFDRVDKSFEDQLAYAIWHNWEVPWRDNLTDRRGGFDSLRESGIAAGEKVKQKEDTLLLSGLGPVTGFQARAGQTFAGSSWTNTGVAHDDIVKAIEEKLRANGIPVEQAAILVNPAELGKMKRKQVGTANFGTMFSELQSLLPGGIYSNSRITAGKAYVYARIPTVVEVAVVQDLTVVPLPRVDEDERGRVRVIESLHTPRTTGIVEITGIA